MRPSYSPMMGILASAVLATFTISVFGRSELRGPEGTIHRYFMAVQAKDARRAAALVIGPTSEFIKWSRFFSNAFTANARYQIVDVRRNRENARAGVILISPNGQELPLIISLRRIGKDWRVNMRGWSLPAPIPQP